MLEPSTFPRLNCTRSSSTPVEDKSDMTSISRLTVAEVDVGKPVHRGSSSSRPASIGKLVFLLLDSSSKFSWP